MMEVVRVRVSEEARNSREVTKSLQLLQSVAPAEHLLIPAPHWQGVRA